MKFTRLKAFAPRALSLLRIVVGLIFICHGLQSIVHWPEGGFGSSRPFDPTSLSGVAGIMNLVGGIFITLGLCTRPIAFVMSGEMAVAYVLVHLLPNLSKPGGWASPSNGGDVTVLTCFIFLYLACAGAGPWSLDARKGRA